MDLSDYISLDFDTGELYFTFKSYSPEKNSRRRGLTSVQIKNEVLQSPRLRNLIREISSEMDVKEKEIEAQAKTIVDEIGHKMSIYAVKTLALMLRGPIRRIYKGIHINKNGFEQLRTAITTQPVIILPSHRSYLDFLLVSYFMLELGIQMPAIAAGEDFLHMKVVSSFLRHSGAFFMRRTFGSDRLYKLIFTLYLQTVVHSRDTPVEFFIEGTRSRTAKSLHPKLGLLSMVVEPYLHGLLPDIVFFPLSISYERTLEETLFAQELLGIPKPKESTSGLMKARSLLTTHYGSIFVEIGSPISLHEVCQQWAISRVPHGTQPRHSFILLPQERNMVTNLGYLILDKINTGMRVFPSAILAAIILQHPHGIDKDELVKWGVWLKKELERRGAVVYWREDATNVVDESLNLLLSGEGIDITPDHTVSIKSHKNGSRPKTDSGSTIQQAFMIEELKKQPLTSTDMAVVLGEGFEHLKLAHYRNQLLHWFLPEAFLLLCLLRLPELNIIETKRRFVTLYKALSREFVLPQMSPEELFIKILQSLVDRGCVEVSVDRVNIASHPRQEEAATFLAGLIQPFVVGVWVMCLYLVSLRGGVQTVKLTYKNTQSLAAKLICRGLISTYEPLSLDILKNAMASLNVAGLILEPELELEGRDRLVKVADHEGLVKLAQDIGLVLFPNKSPILLESKL